MSKTKDLAAYTSEQIERALNRLLDDLAALPDVPAMPEEEEDAERWDGMD